MRFPNDTNFHVRMAGLVVASLFLEHLAATRLPHWSSPQIGIVTFVLGLAWVAMAAWYHARTMQDRLRVLEDRLDRVTRQADSLEDDLRARRTLPPL